MSEHQSLAAGAIERYLHDLDQYRKASAPTFDPDVYAHQAEAARCIARYLANAYVAAGRFNACRWYRTCGLTGSGELRQAARLPKRGHVLCEIDGALRNLPLVENRGYEGGRWAKDVQLGDATLSVYCYTSADGIHRRQRPLNVVMAPAPMHTAG